MIGIVNAFIAVSQSIPLVSGTSKRKSVPCGQRNAQKQLKKAIKHLNF